MIKLNKYCRISPTTLEEYPSVIQYFLSSSPEELKKRGTDASKLPTFSEWHEYMISEHQKPLADKQFFCLSWYYKDLLVGHSCIDNIIFGEQAFSHLHIWKPEFRHKNLGSSFFPLSVHYYFDNFKLQRIYCQPNAQNNDPNRFLKKVGFKLVKSYRTVPHPICYEQEVNLYVLERDANAVKI